MDAKTKNVGVVPLETLLAHDGLSFLQALIDGKLPFPPIMDTLGFRLIAVENGKATFEGLPEPRHYNPIGTVHGGFAATLLDSALSCAVHSTLARGESYTTLELKVNFVRPLTRDTGAINAHGRVIHRGRTVATSEGEIRDGSGRIYAHATATCMIFPAKKET